MRTMLKNHNNEARRRHICLVQKNKIPQMCKYKELLLPAFQFEDDFGFIPRAFSCFPHVCMSMMLFNCATLNCKTLSHSNMCLGIVVLCDSKKKYVHKNAQVKVIFSQFLIKKTRIKSHGNVIIDAHACFLIAYGHIVMSIGFCKYELTTKRDAPMLEQQ